MTALARSAGVLAREYFSKIDALLIESKGHQDLVSNADREVETFIRAQIASSYPEDGIVGEEHGDVAGTSGHVWIIDPIDGTANFVRGIPAWCVVIACTFNGDTIAGAIYEPMTDEMFTGGKGLGSYLNGKPIRASGSKSLGDGSVGIGFSNRREAHNIVPVVSELIAKGGIFFRNASGALMLAYVAAGRLIGYCEEHMNSWDCAAGLLMVEEAGGRICKPDPSTFILNGTMVLAAATDIYDELAAITANSFRD